MKEAKRFWFKRKLYGYGWYPATWEGWTVLAIYVALLLVVMTTLEEWLLIEQPELFLFFMLAWVVSLVGISYVKGETPKWQWGKRKD